jgi:hypothetical protein
VVGLVLAVALPVAAFSGLNRWPYAPAGRSPLLVAVGDTSCEPGAPIEAEKQSDVCDKTGTGYTVRWQAQTATATQVESLHPDLVAVLGDEQYQVGRYQDFMGSFDHTYGAFKFLQRPAPGNHEFYTSHGESGVHGAGYFDYYNGYQVNPTNGNAVMGMFSSTGGAPVSQPIPLQDGQAGHFGASGDGWYSYDLGAWHIISLNIECAVQPGGCDPNGSWLSSETTWLAQDLAANNAACTLAYWHQPTFSIANAAPSAEGAAATAWWQLLYQHGADIVLNGHDHTYARFTPMDPAGKADPHRGIREFIVGTGGESLDPVGVTKNVEASTGDYYGVMALTLNPNGYAWAYQSAMKSPDAATSLPATYTDSGTGQCHAAGDGTSQ